MIALTPSGKVITCDGCKAPVEEVTPDMEHPTPPGVYAGENVRYIVCPPLPDGSQPCLTLARLDDELHLRHCTPCRHALGYRLDVIVAELTSKEN